MNCKICDSKTNQIFKAKVLLKYDVAYYQCNQCEFIQTENPYWLNEAYQNAISNLDLGLIYRNLNNEKIVSKFINKTLNPSSKFIDYGGGYGMFVRIMRDKGFDYYRQDYYCENLFAKFFDVTDLPENTKFELLSAFEVFEHIENPKLEIEKMLKFSDTIIFSTEIQPHSNPNTNNWWYFIPETGQHISLYSKKSLEVLAKSMGLNYYGTTTIHVFSKKNLHFTFNDNFVNSFFNKLNRVANKERPSLLGKDFETVRKKLQSDSN